MLVGNAKIDVQRESDDPLFKEMGVDPFEVGLQLDAGEFVCSNTAPDVYHYIGQHKDEVEVTLQVLSDGSTKLAIKPPSTVFENTIRRLGQNEFWFSVRQKRVDALAWEAVDEKTGTVFDLPRGGNSGNGFNLVGQYPEIHAYLLAFYRVNIHMVFVPSIDNLQIGTDGTSKWDFRRQHAHVTVFDIPRVAVALSFSLASAR